MPDDDDNGDRKRETRKESLMGRFSGSSKTTETSSTTESSEAKNSPVASKTAETSRASSTTEESETEETPTRERKNVNMYLPGPLIDDLELAFDKLNLELRQAGESKLEKNRHYRALVLTLGLDALEDLDVEDVKDVLDGDDRLDDAP